MVRGHSNYSKSLTTTTLAMNMNYGDTLYLVEMYLAQLVVVCDIIKLN